MSHLVVRKEKHRYRVLGIGINFECGHGEATRLYFVTRLWTPILCTFCASSFHHSVVFQIRTTSVDVTSLVKIKIYLPSSHNDDKRLLFPNHPPEIPAGFRQRTLRADKRVLLLVTVDEISIYIVGSGVSVYLRQAHSAVIVTQDIRVPIFRLVWSQPRKTDDPVTEIIRRKETELKVRRWYVLCVIKGTFRRSLLDFSVLCYETCSTPRMNIFDELFHGDGLKSKVAVEAVVIAEAWTSWGRRLNRWRRLIGSNPDIAVRDLDVPDVRDTIFHFTLIDYRTSWATNRSCVGTLISRLTFRRGR